MQKPKAQKLEIQKVLMMGLDKSGKSSIALTLKNETNLMNYLSLKPTIGVEVSKIEHDKELLLIWDLGGQKAYRDKYKENFDKYFTGAERIIYVIDVQDNERYSLSLDYLRDVLSEIKENDSIKYLTIFFHKYDPNIKKTDPDIDQAIREDLLPKIKVIVPSWVDFKSFKTTIFTAFHRIFIQ